MADTNGTRPRRQGIIGPVILLTLGILFLLNNFGILPWSFWGTLWQFWPVILILIGLDLLFGRAHPLVGVGLTVIMVAAIVLLAVLFSQSLTQTAVAPGTETTERVVQEAGSIERATIDVDFGAGELVLASLPTETKNLAEADVTHGQPGRTVSRRFSTSNREGRLRLESEGSFSFPVGNGLGEYWSLKLTPNLPLDLNLKTGASRNTVDLSDLKVRQLRLDVGAGAAAVVFPKQGSTRASVKAGAADLTVEIPQGVAAQIRADVGVGSFNVDAGRFPRSGKYYVSSDFDSAANRVELEIDGGVASITVR